MKRHLVTIGKIRCQQLFGFVPKDLRLTYAPLRILSSDQEETVKTQKSARILSFYQAGLISQKDALDAANKGKLFDIQIDTTGADTALLDPNEESDEDEESTPAGSTAGAKSKTQAKVAKAAKE
jgi:hypothetical protein